MKKKTSTKPTYADFKLALKERFLLDINDVNVTEEKFNEWIKGGDTIEGILDWLGEKYDLSDCNEFPFTF